MGDADEARWLDAEEYAAWRSLLATVSLLESALDRQLQRDAGMPHAYYQILAMLSETPGRALRMSDLADITQSSQSRLSHAVSRLEARGWVRRRPCPDDRRSTFAELTAAGQEVLVAAAPGHVECVRQNLFDQLTRDQVRALTEVCTAALGRLAAAPGAGPLRGALQRAQGVPDVSRDAALGR
ncbi:MarR family winged helix-turn-helix transcriptional regulator [Pseudonocardia benzenivorans]|jgi:DNA-binding MarR family transcriptional regulator|uniref:Regulatory protein MarR n=2 Tax=Pseudonocardia TaxID=1847 RepID=F4CZU3_PSEUX|nr:MarR family winged helix-turn-helix transcriptional regulator [Pseudonocardia dioxanivorans]AEA27769.1 regulatory protein MarR [Pseudonocardia dioxanivorans CB1190]GJF05416.1 MarR family transcriptional regulator [Pseudonocardia sp. D17]